MPNDSEPRRGLLQRVWSVVDANERYLRSIQPQVDQINALEPEFEQLSQQDLKDRLRKITSRVETARERVLAEQALEPPPADSDARQRRVDALIAAEKEVLDEHLPEVFAAVREAAKRTLSMRHFDVQLLGGIVLHEGRIAEMKTGDGKTLTATLPLVLHALAGRGAHLVTVNDYLARRDAEWMGKIYRYLGLTVGVIQHDLTPQERQRAYAADITYITNHEIGFDYLRDNWRSFRPEQLVIRELHYAIIDEVDSILVDEARVPLIISAARGKPAESYRKVQEVVSRLTPGEQDEESKEITNDFYVDEKAKNAVLSEDGQRKVEIALGIDNLNDSAHIEEMHLVSAALKANFCYKRDVDYIVGPAEGGVPGVVIVDSFTGRPQPGRRWSDGLHQAIEAKERVVIQDEQQTVATVTYQNFFLMYHRLAGMTGTAKTEEAEFVDIYDMHVVVVPTNKPMIRRDHDDVVYKNVEWKTRGICCEIVQLYCRRQPVLVGTRSVETSEQISSRLTPEAVRMQLQLMLLQWHIIENEKRLDKRALAEVRPRSTVPLEDLRQREIDELLALLSVDGDLRKPEVRSRVLHFLDVPDTAETQAALQEVIDHGVPHEVLNARHHEREAQIVAQAGRLGAVTIATNMAGRGTDIVLGGNPEPDIEEMLYLRGIDPKSLSATLFINAALKGDADLAARQAAEEGGLPRAVLAEVAQIRAAWQSEQKDVIAAGGLSILGTERHESRRIDNQLRGRSGRQGDPGAARFYVSLEDELMRLFAPERFKMLQNQWPDEQPVEAKLISKSIGNAQRKVEARNFEIRKNTLRYDDVMNVQRKHIYGERRRILEGYDLRETVNSMMGDLVTEQMAIHAPPEAEPEEWDTAELWTQLNGRFALKDQLRYESLLHLGRERLEDKLKAAAERAYDEKESDFIRAVVEFELQASIHETLQQLSDRNAVCAVLTTLWPLREVLPSGLENVPDGRVPETLFQLARESLERAPRRFILQLVRDRVGHDAQAGRLAGLWPVKATSPESAVAEVEAKGWGFVGEALRHQMEQTVAAAVPATCDLDRLVAEVGALWPLGEELDAERLAAANYGVIVDRLERMATQSLEQERWAFLERVAEHRGLPRETVILEAVEATVAQAAAEAHRHVSAGGGEEEDEESLEYGDLQRVIANLTRDWALGTALDAWQLERLPTAEQRQEIIGQTRAEVRSRGQRFVDDTARQRFDGVIDQALAEHLSIHTVCTRLIQEFQLPGAFETSRYEGLRTADELTQALVATAREELEEDPDWLAEFGRAVRAQVAEHFSLERLCATLNERLQPDTPLSTRELAAVEPEEVRGLLGEVLEPGFEAFRRRFVLDCLAQHLRLSLDQALTTWYDLRTLSHTVAAAWPIDTDAVRATKLKAWPYRELGKKLGELLLEAAGAEVWRFIRRLVANLLETGLDEALAVHCPADRRRAEWDLEALEEDLAARWRPAEPIDAYAAGDVGREALRDHLYDQARLAYQREERRFVRETARHRFSQQLDGWQATHYSLARACDALGHAWGIPGAFQPAELADVRSLLRAGGGDVEVKVGELIEPHLSEAEQALHQAATERRIADSVDDVLRRTYNTGDLVESLLGRWAAPEGGVSAAALRGLPYRELLDHLRKLLLGADGSLRRRVVFSHLRQSADELDLAVLAAGAADEWHWTELAAAFSQALPRGLGRDAAELAGRVLRAALTGPIATAAATVSVRDAAVVRRAVAAHAERTVRELLPVERRPQGLAELLGGYWPLAEINLQKLRGADEKTVVDGLVAAAVGAVDAGLESFLAAAVERWIARTVSEALDRYWPADRDPGPWVLSQVCSALDRRWQLAEPLGPTHFKGLDRPGLSAALVAAGAQRLGSSGAGLVVGEAAAAALEQAAVAAAGAIDRETGRWDLAKVAATLADGWLGQAPDAAAIAAAVSRDELAAVLRAMAEEREPQAVSQFGEEPVQQWLSGRIDRALARHCSLRLVCRELARRWPMDELDANAYAQMPYRELREALIAACVEACRAGGEAFLVETSRMRLDNDVAVACSRHLAGEQVDAAAIVEAIEPRWRLGLRESELSGLRPAQVRATLSEAAGRVETRLLLDTFRYETMRRRLRQTVEEAQREHCNPDIAADRWDQAAFVAALERQWPIAGRLEPESLRAMDARELRTHARDVLFAAFDGHEPRFIRETTRHQLALALRDILREQASLDRLTEQVGAGWPDGSRDWSREALVTARRQACVAMLGRLTDEDEATRLVDELVDADGSDFTGLADEVLRRWPSAVPPDRFEFDEWTVRLGLELCLDEDFAGNPRAFVKAVALEDVPRQLERRVMLDAIDTNWCNHLEAMDYLKEGINLRGYGQTDPFIAYRRDGRTMFENMLGRIRETVIGSLFETTERQLVEMHQRGRLGLRIAVQYENVRELAAKAEELTGAQQQQRAEREARRERRRQRKAKTAARV